jgi:hypothetical protein
MSRPRTFSNVVEPGDSILPPAREEAKAIAEMVRRGALTREQASTLIEFTHQQQLNAV